MTLALVVVVDYVSLGECQRLRVLQQLRQVTSQLLSRLVCWGFEAEYVSYIFSSMYA